MKISETSLALSVANEEKPLSISESAVISNVGEEQQTLTTNLINKLVLFGRYRIFISKVGVGVALLAVIIAFALPKQFESTTRLMPPDQNDAGQGKAILAALSGQAGALGAIAADTFGVKSSGSLVVGVLQSRTVTEGLVRRFGLQEIYRTKREEEARQILVNSTEVAEDRKSGIITITVTDRDPRRAAAIAAGYVDEVDRLIGNLSTSSAHRERVFLESRLTEVKKDLDEAAESFGQFASKNSTIDIQTQARAMVDAAAQLEGQRMAAESELQGLKQIYSDNNIRVREAEARIGELQKEIRNLSGPRGSSEVAATQKSESPYPSIKELPILGVTFSDLYRRTKIEESIFQTLTQQYELAKVEEAKELPSVRVLDPAEPPDKKSAPNRLRIVLWGGFLGLFFGCGIVWIRDVWARLDGTDERKVFLYSIWNEVRKNIASLRHFSNTSRMRN